jgi:threo-3-hydroxy-L-aspartate ammonia-lyase
MTKKIESYTSIPEATSISSLVNYADIEVAARYLVDKANKTPVFTSRTINQNTKSEVFFKCENFQRTGSFKFRGAYNALIQLSQEKKLQGILTYSSGNHAQAIALASQLLGIKATIIMPEDAPDVKKLATHDYGAEIIFYDRFKLTIEELIQTIALERKLIIIPPYNHPHVVAGQGTAAKELFEEVRDLDFLLVPCGGGGLLSGSAITAKYLSPKCQVIGVEPEQADDAARSFHSKVLHTIHNPDTIADGARTSSLGTITFPLILNHVDDLVTVSEKSIKSTMSFLWDRMKIVVEPTGALAVAALLEGKIVTKSNAKIGVIVSGGNVEIIKDKSNSMVN